MTISKCKYKLKTKIIDYSCPHLTYKNDSCIFHLRKATRNEEMMMTKKGRAENEKLMNQFFAELNSYMNSVQGECKFIGFVFPKTYWGSETVFNKPMNFSFSKFPHSLSISNGVVFNEKATFDFCILESAYFYASLRFNDYVSFRNATFYGKGCFQNVECEKHATFEGARFFSDNFDFNGTNFKKGVAFLRTSFRKDPIRFYGDDVFFHRGKYITKTSSVKFSNTHFYLSSHFLKTSFHIDADFRAADFNDEVVLDSCVFLKNATFTQAEFNGEVHFGGTKFLGKGLFNQVKVKNELLIEGGRNNRCFYNDADFSRLKILKDARVVFDKVDLSKASFLYTNLEEAKFLDVDWFKQNKEKLLITNRSQLWDEERLDSSNELYERVADNYRQLVNNYEKKRDFETAEYFHIGEMEIRRKKHKHKSSIGIEIKWWRRFRGSFNATGFYWLSSRYGSSYMQGIIILILLAFVVNPIFLLLAGFQTSKEEKIEKIINFNLIPNSTDEIISFSRFWDGYWSAISYVFSIITFQKDRFYVPQDNNWWSQMALYLAMFLLTTQAALVLLAIRRQFRR